MLSDEYYDEVSTTVLHNPGPPPRRPPPNGAHPERSDIQAGDLCVGCIVWLPPKDALNSGIKCVCAGCSASEELDERGYNHPVVVLKIRQNANSTRLGDLVLHVACVSSFSY
jgi:hypothetical protein